jgi:SAM-dependent methyltransferase
MAALKSFNTLPMPPFEMRQLVGPTDEAAFDNPSGGPIFADVPDAQFESVVDFGCGCGRLARQMLQQRVRPRRYLGFDLHPGMVRWCQRELTPHAPSFEFKHHDIHNPIFNPGPPKPYWLPMPAENEVARLMIALSVFTHTTQAQTEHYLREVARVLHPEGVLIASWFLFEKRFFPMMHDFQNTLYINIEDPTNATIFDREWLEGSLRNLGLGVTRAVQPGLRGHQWLLHIRRLSAGEPTVAIPEDQAPFGRLPPPIPIMDPAKVGLS